MMNKIDWKRKLSSRKFWALIAGFITGIIIYIQSPEKSPESIGGIIMTLGSIIAYIIGEGIADHSNSFVELDTTLHESEEENNG